MPTPRHLIDLSGLERAWVIERFEQADRLRAAAKSWREAQTRFEAAFGGERAAKLRDELRALVSSDLGTWLDADKNRRPSTRAAP